VPVDGSDDEAQWDSGEDEELATMTRMVAEGMNRAFAPKSRCQVKR
jgi:hypothetical protein